MNSLLEAKQEAITDTPLFLFDCTLPDGTTQHWSTHQVSLDGIVFQPRVVGHSAFDMKAGTDDGADGAAKITLTLANADSYFSEIGWNVGWKGARLTVRFLFFDLRNDVASSDSQVVFQGMSNSADEVTESTAKVTFTNRLNLQRVGLPEIRIQKRCPWLFPSVLTQRQEAATGGKDGSYSPFYRCGYSADIEGGVGNRKADGSCYTSCDYTRSQCEQRGMFDTDSQSGATRRFGGFEFVPPSILVRSYGDKSAHASGVLDNEARYNDFVPVVYGTAWYKPPVVFARNDGNLTRMELLLASGEIASVVKVVVNDVEIPQGVAGANMTATGWYNVTATGARSGEFNMDFTDSKGKAAGDPYGSMAAMSVVVPNRISSGQSLPKIEVLIRGSVLARYGTDGTAAAATFTNNPAWVLLDVLRRSGWKEDGIDLGSFGLVAARCDEPVQTLDVLGNDATVARYECNMVLRKRRSAADIVRGIRAGAALILSYTTDGRLQLRSEGTIALQQPTRQLLSNSTDKLNDGWPSYEFSDGSAAFSGILRKDNGEPHIRFWSRPGSDTPNRLSIEFQDELNEYQQDSLSLVDVADATATGQEIASGIAALGVANFSQAMRISRLQLNKSIEGNLYVEFGSSVRAFGLLPGDIIAITYEKEGLVRQPFRVQRVAPGLNYRTAVITAQLHEDAWYIGNGSAAGVGARRQPRFGVGIPRSVLGSVSLPGGDSMFGITEELHESSSGTSLIGLSVSFAAPQRPSSSGPSIPLLSLTPLLDSTGGTLQGGQTLYYAVSGVAADGAESPLSFTVKASIPTATDTNQVKLENLSFSSGSGTFNVYRGSTPAEMIRIATDTAITSEFVDEGIVPTSPVSPPDENYDHANFYWRFEIQAEVSTTAATTNTISNQTLTMLANENRGMILRVTEGKGRGQERLITANTPTTVSVSPAWDLVPNMTSKFVIAEPSWRFGALTILGPAEFEVPSRQNATIHIMGRSANVHDQECAAELSVITRWQLGGTSDAGVAAEPTFALAPTGQGTVELSSIGFSTLANSHSIMSGTFGVYYWDELAEDAPLRLVAGIGISDTSVEVTGQLAANDVLQIGHEILIVESVSEVDTQIVVTRGAFHSVAGVLDADAAVYRLSRRTYVVPFARGLFGSPAGGSYNFPIYLPDVRLGAAELFVTNDFGNSPTGRSALTATADGGIRTLSGGQFAIQVEGTLAVQTDAAPVVVVEDTHSVRDVYAVLREPAQGGSIQLRIRQDEATWSELTIPAGASVSNVVDGFGRAPLRSKALLSLDVVSVPEDPQLFPGRDLSVTIRL